MKEIMFPELSEKKQQSIYGAWGGSRSDQDYREDIPNYELDNIIIPSDGGGGDFGGGSSSGDSDYNISNDAFIDFASGEGSDATNNEVAEKIRAAAAAAGLAAGAAYSSQNYSMNYDY
ncbi:hypothetical protein [Myroides odoratimimus]|uniref:hypothetical protein n=1 Tax=Myroides odoratimimus TaxID=76832 RepID=UPI0031016D3C